MISIRRVASRVRQANPWPDLFLPLLAGGLIAIALPPWNIGSSALGLGLWLHLLCAVDWRVRVRRSGLVALAWFGPATVWMVDLTAPGWPVALIFWSALYGAAGAVVPSDGRRRWAFPAVITLVALLRWYVPFGGVPIATIAMAEVGTPSDEVVRWLGSPFLVLLTALIAVAVAEAIRLIGSPVGRELRAWAPAGVALASWMGVVIAATAAPRAHTVGTLDVAMIQGGGEQNTRADICENREVFDRHVAATALIEGPVDLIVWPEDVVHATADGSRAPARCEKGLLERTAAMDQLWRIAVEHDAVLVTGWFERSADGTANVNYALAMGPGGDTDRYDKVRLVPFGEFVPLRSWIEAFSDELPLRDVRAGTEPAVLDTAVGRLGVAISWEIFFDHRARDAIGNGGQVLLNPTNGSSYWLTLLQSQQIATSRLRALETDRWVLQVSPTGFSAIVNPAGEVLERTGTEEQRVVQATIELREGSTTAIRWGAWPALLVSVAALASARAGDLVDRLRSRALRSRRAE